MTEFLDIRREGGLLLLTIDREDARNALHGPACWEMADALDAFAADDELAVAILTGAGDEAFCAGSAPPLGDLPPTGFGGLTHRHDLDKPVIAAANGQALGGGFELALACDLIVSAEHAAFGLPEVRMGRTPAAGGLVRLPRQLGPKRANALALTGAQVGAQTLLEWGVVHQVVPRGQLMDATRALAGQILESDAAAVRKTKRVLRGQAERKERDALERRWK
jgi:enoyl-CoA hydratase/carnithine racemase